MPESVNRRRFIAATAAAAATLTAKAREYGPGAPPVHYPDPDIVVLDERFGKYRLGNTPIQRIHTGNLWAEGPAWNGVGNYLLWSDIPSNVQRRWLNENGQVSVFRNPSQYSNGNTFDFSGRQISCQHFTRKVVRFEYSGKETVLADKSPEGKEFNAPNDAVVHPNTGDIWFTDPGYGGLMNYEGNRLATGSPQPNQKEAVYRIDGKTGQVKRVTDDIYKPNGLCFSQDYKKLYVADTGSSHYKEAKKEIRVWDIVNEKTLANGRSFASMQALFLPGGAMATDAVRDEVGDKAEPLLLKAGQVDGIRCDTDGNIWASAGWVGKGYDGVHIFAPDGTRIGHIRLPEICSNVCFGGPRRNRLFMTASQSVYAVYVETQGAHIT